jgi:hypothetical protein
MVPRPFSLGVIPQIDQAWTNTTLREDPSNDGCGSPL